MVEIKYREFSEIVDLAGLTIAEARKQFKDELGIPDKAQVKLNGRKVNRKLEAETSLCDEDMLTFAEARNKGAFLVATVLLALAITGGAFAYGYTTASTPLSVTASGSDFAAVTVNSSSLPTWTPYGFFKGSIAGPSPIFDVDTWTSQYTGDMVVTVSIANADQLVSVYRVLALKIDAIGGNGSNLDVNGDTTVTANDYALLTMGNGSVDLYMGGAADNITIRVKDGFYVSHIWGTGWTGGYETPLLYAEVAQR
ncbi:hypothetical protein ACFLXH_06290 [Chloroflexota bacterium]